MLRKSLLQASAIALAAGLAQAGDLHVSAAASLTNAFTDIAAATKRSMPAPRCC
jgi:ABC-type molybdate transport system substrate-binding protein